MALLALAVAAFAAMALAPAASAVPKGAINDFGSLGAGNGQFGTSSPTGIAVNQTGAGGAGAGDIYVVDAANNRVQRFNADGDFLGSFGTAGSGNGQFSNPQGIAIDPTNGDVYVTDVGNFRVQKFTPTGGFLRMWGNGVAGTNLVSEIQTATIAATAGGIRWRPNGNGSSSGQTPELPYNAPAATVQAALEESSSIGVGNVTVSGGPGDAGGTKPYVITFIGSAAGFNRIQMGFAVGSAGLTGTASFATVTEGSAPFQICTSSESCRAGFPGNGAGQFGTVAGRPAVDPSTRELYVGDPANRRVNVYDPAGNFLRAMGWDVSPGGAAAFETCTATCQGGNISAGTQDGRFGSNQPVHLAIDSSGATHVLFASDSNLSNRVQRINITAPAAPVAMTAIGSSGAPLLNAPTSGLAVDPATNNLLVARDPTSGETVIQEVTNPTNTIAPLPAVSDSHATGEGWIGTTVGTSPGLVGSLAVRGSNGRIFVTRPGVGQVAILAAPGAAPSASLNATSAITATTATLNAAVNPNGAKTYYQFQYRAVGAPSFTSAPTALASAGTGTANVNVTAALTGLLPGTAYEVQLLVDGYGAPLPLIGTDATGDFATPATPPAISNRAAAPVTDTTALLQAQITPNNAATTYYFQYLSDADFKANGNSYSGPNVPTQTPAVPAVLPAGMSPVVVFQQVTGLSSQTTYHFRVVANNGTGGDQLGVDQAFTTEATPGPSPDVNRAYEMVSPPYKIGGLGTGVWYKGVGAHVLTGKAALEGDRYASQSAYGSVLADGSFAYASDYTLGDRTETGWVNRPAFNRGGGLTDSEYAKRPYLGAASDDFSVLGLTSQNVLQIFPEQAEAFNGQLADVGGMALREWETGRWEIVAPTARSQEWEGGGSTDDVASVLARGGGHVLVEGILRGVAGPSDPTHAAFKGSTGDLLLEPNKVVYIDDVSAGLSDSFPGAGIRALVNVCSGAGDERTEIPSVTGGKVTAEECPAVLPGREARLIEPRGASIDPAAPGTISDDGSRAFFVSPDAARPQNLGACTGTGPALTRCPPQVYVRQRNSDGSVTVRWISRSTVANQDASLMAPVFFKGATPDGDKAFFLTTAPLTPDDPNGTGSQVPGGVTTGSSSATSLDLYMYDFPDAPDAGPGDGTLTRISAGPTGAGDGNFAIGEDNLSLVSPVRAFSDAGTRVYFVTSAPLPGVADPSNGTITAPTGSPGQTATKNLYVYDAGLPLAKRWRFVAALPSSSTFGSCASKGGDSRTDPLVGDQGAGTQGLVELPNESNCMRANQDGSFVTFFTDGRLTADDPDSVSGDVYGYDADEDELIRLSESQGGVGGSYVCITKGTGMGATCNGDFKLGTALTGSAPYLVSRPSDPNDRIVFFESKSSLVPEDENSVYDVYQWRNGSLSLLSTGDPAADETLYRGSDRSGTNVYLSTRDALTWQDVDAELDVYVARVNGGFPEPVTPPICDVLADACQQAPAFSPASAGASSALFAGAGNVVEKQKEKKRKKCAAGKVRKGKRCVAGKGKRNANTTRRAAK